MEKEQIKETLIGLITDLTGIDKEEITNESNFKNDLGFDSLDDVELIINCETKFNISINDSECESIKTVQNAIDLLEKTINN